MVNTLCTVLALPIDLAAISHDVHGYLKHVLCIGQDPARNEADHPANFNGEINIQQDIKDGLRIY